MIPVVEGRTFAATIAWMTSTRVLHVSWPAGGKPTMAIDKAVEIPGAKRPKDFYGTEIRMDFASPTERAICDCWNKTYGGQRYGSYNNLNKLDGEVFSCHGMYGTADAGCVAAYPGQCGELLACIRRDPAAYPPASGPAAPPSPKAP